MSGMLGRMCSFAWLCLLSWAYLIELGGLGLLDWVALVRLAEIGLLV